MQRHEKRQMQRTIRKDIFPQLERCIEDKIDNYSVYASSLKILDEMKSLTAKTVNNAVKVAQNLSMDVIRMRTSAKPVSCAKGCSMCCHLYTSATAPEIFSIKQRLLKGGFDVEKFLSTTFGGEGEHHTKRVPGEHACPLLSLDGLCGVYADRPLACIRMASYSLPACQKAFSNRGGDIPFSGDHIEIVDSIRIAYKAALLKKDLDYQAYELISGLKSVLQHEDAETDWLSGNSVFSPTSVDDSLSTEEDEAIKYISSQL